MKILPTPEVFLDKLDRCEVCSTSYPLKELYSSGVMLCDKSECEMQWCEDNKEYSIKFFKEFGSYTHPLVAKAHYDHGIELLEEAEDGEV